MHRMGAVNVNTFISVCTFILIACKYFQKTIRGDGREFRDVPVLDFLHLNKHYWKHEIFNYLLKYLYGT